MTIKKIVSDSKSSIKVNAVVRQPAAKGGKMRPFKVKGGGGKFHKNKKAPANVQKTPVRVTAEEFEKKYSRAVAFYHAARSTFIEQYDAFLNDEGFSVSAAEKEFRRVAKRHDIVEYELSSGRVFSLYFNVKGNSFRIIANVKLGRAQLKLWKKREVA